MHALIQEALYRKEVKCAQNIVSVCVLNLFHNVNLVSYFISASSQGYVKSKKKNTL